MNVTMYDKLLQLPLFQGLCKSDFTQILEKVRLHFQNFETGNCIARQGSESGKLLFLLDGVITVETVDKENHFVLYEELDSPCVIEPYSLYGMRTRYTSSYIAKTGVGIVTIEKSYIMSILSKYPIFQLNFLNLLCNRAQSLQSKLWYTHIGDIDTKIVNFLLARCIRPIGKKTLRIRMEDLAMLINETRINVSRVLNEYQGLGLAELNRKEVIIPDLENLTEHLKKITEEEKGEQ